MQERRKDLTDYRDESTFSFDPSRIPVKKLSPENRVKPKVDSRKGVLLSSVTRKRKKSRRRRTPSTQRRQQTNQLQEQQDEPSDRDEDATGGVAAAETEAEVATATDAYVVLAEGGGATTSADDGEDSGSQPSTPCRKHRATTSSPNRPAVTSPHPATPPPQPEPPPVTATNYSDTANAKLEVTPTIATTADTLRPCALAAPQGQFKNKHTCYDKNIKKVVVSHR